MQLILNTANSIRLITSVLLLVFALAPFASAQAQSGKDDAKKAPPKPAAVVPAAPAGPAPPKGDVVMESISQPIVRGTRVVGYEHATIIMWLRTRDHASLVCSNRYKMADMFLIDLHDNPISSRRKKEGRGEVEQRLYDLAAEIFGPRVIKRLRVEWARSPTGGKTTIFGTFTDVQCDAAS